MKAYVKNGVVIATHDDWQEVPASEYGEEVTIYSVPNSVKPLEKIKKIPEAEEVPTI